MTHGTSNTVATKYKWCTSTMVTFHAYMPSDALLSSLCGSAWCDISCMLYIHCSDSSIPWEGDKLQHEGSFLFFPPLSPVRQSPQATVCLPDSRVRYSRIGSVCVYVCATVAVCQTSYIRTALWTKAGWVVTAQLYLLRDPRSWFHTATTL